MEPPRDLDRDLPEYQEYVNLLADRFYQDPATADPQIVEAREQRIRELFEFLSNNKPSNKL